MQRKGRIETDDPAGERAAEAGKPAAGRECERENAYRRRCRGRSACGRSSTAARSRLPKRVSCEHELESEREQAADDDDEKPIDADARAEKIEPSGKARRQIDDLLIGAHEIIDHGRRHEDEADRKQHLIEMALVIEMDIERAFEQKAERGGEEESRGQAPEEGNAPSIRHDDGEIAAGHGEGAMREIDEIHQSERDAEADGEHEEQHAVGGAVEKDGQHGQIPSMCVTLSIGRSAR